MTLAYSKERETSEPAGPALSGASARSERLPVTSVLLLAAWFGLLTGLAELAVMGVHAFVLDKMVHQGHHAMWMAPLGALAVLTAAALSVRLLGCLAPWLASLRVTVFVLALLAASSLRWMDYRVHAVAWLLLSAGAAAVLARLAAAHPRGFMSGIRKSLGWLGGSAALVAVAVPLRLVLLERHALRHLPASPPEAPNVLLIVMDTVRAKSLSAYGYERPTTPRLERLAKSGVKFDRAVSTAPWTLTSHASMFTGRRPFEMSANWERPLDERDRTLAEALGEHGYETAGFVANLAFCCRQFGLDRGFVHYEDYPVSWGTLAGSSYLARELVEKVRRITKNPQKLVRKDAAQVNREFLTWLDRRSGQRPFFAFLNYMDAHDPYIPPPPWSELFGDTRPKTPRITSAAERSTKETAALRDAYDRCLAYLDDQIGRLLDELESRGALGNTLVIVTADHGEQFGEHGLLDHGNSLYRPLVHVPLIFRLPSRVPQGATVSQPVSLIDLPATVIDLLGLVGERLPGASLADHWGQRPRGDRAHTAIVAEVRFARNNSARWPISKGDMRSIIVDGYHYIRRGDGQEELYDFVGDPEEQRDLAPGATAQARLDRCRAALRRLDASSAP